MLFISRIISRQKRLSVSLLFPSNARKVNTKTWEFTDTDRGISGVVHHTIVAEPEDQESEKVASAIHNVIVKHRDSLFFLTEKSRLLRRSEFTHSKRRSF